MYNYEIVEVTGGYGFKVYNDSGELVVDQPFNPLTGQPFTSEDEAKQYAEETISEMNMNELVSTPPHLKIQFLNPTTNEPINVANTGSDVKVNVELYYLIGVNEETGEPEVMYAPVTGDYIVTYFYKNTDTPAGSTIIHIDNGKGSGIIQINKSGVFEIKLDRVLNAQTMKQPEPLPIPDENPTIAIVEPVKEDTDTSTTTE